MHGVCCSVAVLSTYFILIWFFASANTTLSPVSGVVYCRQKSWDVCIECVSIRSVSVEEFIATCRVDTPRHQATHTIETLRCRFSQLFLTGENGFISVTEYKSTCPSRQAMLIYPFAIHVLLNVLPSRSNYQPHSTQKCTAWRIFRHVAIKYMQKKKLQRNVNVISARYANSL